MQGMHIQIVPLVFTLLIVWRLMVRFRRNVGRQPLRPRRMIVTICIYSAVTILLGAGSLLVGHMNVFAGLLCGLVPGAALGFYGLHLTRFEATPQGFFYTPNAYVGVGLSALFVARLAYRAMVFSSAATRSTAPQPFQSPLTMFLYGLLAGYYVAYYAGVLVRSNEPGRPAP
jgi:hypothetical protein